MRMHPQEFPPNRRGDPKRRAELRVFEALAGINRQGFVHYEWRRGYERIELDFAVWIEGLGRFALQVKGGRYRIIDGQWHLATRDGLRPVRLCPLDEAKLGALDLHDDISEGAGAFYNPYVIPVLSLPDMTESDPSVESLARRKGVYVVWGVENLLLDLEQIVRGRSVSDRLPTERIANEVLAVTDGLIRLDARVSGSFDLGVGDTSPARERNSVKEVRLWVGETNVVTIRSGSVRCWVDGLMRLVRPYE